MAPKHLHRFASTSVAALLVATASLAGCQSIQETFRDQSTVVEAKEPTVERVYYQHDVTFAPGSSVLNPAETADLDAFVRKTGLSSGDRVYVVEPAVPGTLDRARADAVTSRLFLGGKRVDRVPARVEGPAVMPDAVALVVERTAIRLPACPNWTDRPNQDFDNQPGSNWGCATAINFGMHIANPNDLVAGRDPGTADGTVMARSVRRYRLGETKDIIRDAASAEIFPSSSSEDKGGPVEKGE
jgi:pilus assembly protein CpaD